MSSVLAWAGGRAGILTDSWQLCQPIRGKLRFWKNVSTNDRQIVRSCHSVDNIEWQILKSVTCVSNTTKASVRHLWSEHLNHAPELPRAEPRSRHEYCQIVTVSGVTSPVTQPHHTSHCVTHVTGFVTSANLAENRSLALPLNIFDELKYLFEKLPSSALRFRKM